MPTFNSAELIQSLSNDVQETIDAAQQLQHLPEVLLQTQPAPGKWSVVQLLEHLNSYNRYYLPQIEKALQEHTGVAYNPVFKAGVFGNYFTNMMLPKAGGRIANKMQAPKDHRPADILDVQKVQAEFMLGQQKLLFLLQQAANTDMGRLKVPISISRFIKLKMGDTFRFLVAHQQRHFIQLSNAITAIDGGNIAIKLPA